MRATKKHSLILIAMLITAVLLPVSVFICAGCATGAVTEAANESAGYVASVKIGDIVTEYSDFGEAWNAASSAGATVTLLADVSTTEEYQLRGDSATLDLDGHILRIASDSGTSIYLDNYAELTIKDSNTNKLKHKYYVGENGLWIFDETLGTQTLEGGVITGGSECVLALESTVRMEGGAICGNTVIGVEVNSSGTFQMTGGRICGNRCGVQVEGGNNNFPDCTLEVSGAPIITENKKSDGSDNNVILVKTIGDPKITVAGKLEDEDGNRAQIGVSNSSNSKTVIATGLTVANNPSGKKPSEYFIPDNPEVCIALSDAENGIVTISGEHTGGTATCIAKPICTVCDLSYGEINPDGHAFATDYTVDVEPTCTEKGSKSKHCTLCDAKTDVTEIPARGHVFAHYEAQGATCEEDGVLAYSHCSVCDKNYIDGVEKSEDDLKVPALGHDYGEWTVTKPATATEEGEEQRVCSHDPSHVETRPIAKLTTPEQPNPEPTPEQPNPEQPEQTAPAQQPQLNTLWIVILVLLAVIVASEVAYLIYHFVSKKKE